MAAGRLAPAGKDIVRADAVTNAVIRHAASLPDQSLRSTGTTPLRDRTHRLLEASGVDPAQRERWRREGEALEEAQIAALCALAYAETKPTA